MTTSSEGLRFSRAAAALPILGFLISFIAGCDEMRSHADLRWTESVTLASGETVRIQRHVDMWHHRALGGGFSSAPQHKTSSIELAEGGDAASIWDAPMVPIVLDKDPATNEWIVVAGSDGCDIWVRNGRPRPPYWAFRLRDGKWYRDAIPKSFLERPANLFVEFDVTDESADLNEQINARKQSQAKNAKHAPQYGSIDSTFNMRCDRAPSQAIGNNEIDLKKFRTLP